MLKVILADGMPVLKSCKVSYVPVLRQNLNKNKNACSLACSAGWEGEVAACPASKDASSHCSLGRRCA